MVFKAFRALPSLRSAVRLLSSATPPPPAASNFAPLPPGMPSATANSIANVIARKQRVSADLHSMMQETSELGLDIERTTVNDLLRRKSKGERGDWLWVDTNDSVLSAVHKMTKANVGALLVMHESVLDANSDGVVSEDELHNANACKAVAGIITERDYLRKTLVLGKDADKTKVSDIMTSKRNVIMAHRDTPLLEVMRIMTEGRFRHLPILNNDKTMAGMVSIGDVTKMILSEHREEVRRLRDFVAGGY